MQCNFEWNTMHVVDLGESVTIPVGDDCLYCGPCTDDGMTCYQMFRFVPVAYISELSLN